MRNSLTPYLCPVKKQALYIMANLLSIFPYATLSSHHFSDVG